MNASPFQSRLVEASSEITRISNLPRRVWPDEAAIELAAMLTRELKTPGGTMALRPVQAIALYEAMETGGLFGPLRVGSGKSLICALAPLVLEAKRPVLLMPASLVGKTWSEREVLKEHWRLPSNVQILSYESLSLVQSERKLDYIEPDLLICDEAHFLKGHRAGRTRRVVRYMRDRPDTKFVAVSGTIMRASIRDFAHLLRFALKNRAPIPSTEDETAAWADAVDETVNPIARRKLGALLQLGPAVEGPSDLIRARRVFQSRLLETPGVVASSRTDGVTCSIRIQALEYEPSQEIVAHFKTLKEKWETPCGKAFSEPFEMRMYTRELALGFTYTWIAREKVGEWENLVKKSEKLEIGILANVGMKRTETASANSKSVNEKFLLKNSENISGRKTDVGTQPTVSELTNAKQPTEKAIQKNTRSLSSAGTTLIASSSENTPNDTKKNTASEPANFASFEKRTTPKKTETPRVKGSTESSPSSIGSLLLRRQASAQSAGGSEGAKVSASITTTRQDKSEDFSAPSAILASVNSGTMPLGLSAPLRTFLEQNRSPPEWLRARREWCSFVRETIDESQQYDTMLQVANACRAGLVGSETLDAWKAIESSYEPLTRPIFYDTTALETCLTWLKDHVGIVWVEHQAFGAALAQLSGCSYFGPGGLDASGASIANATGKESVIASVAACGQGFNLQMFSKNLITSCPSGAATIEQVLGRTHRDGQLADEVEVWILLGCYEHFDSFERALDSARAAADVLGHEQKLLISDVLMPDVSLRVGPLWQ